MNIDENVKKIVLALLKKWKLIVIFAVIGAMAGYFYTANFTTLTYTSSVEFLAYAVDSNSELSDTPSKSPSNSDIRSSNTSKMNYVMNMMDTYIEIMKTNVFNAQVAKDLNDRLGTNYNSNTIKYAVNIEQVEGTAMFKIYVSTTSADLSFEIAHQMETSIPEMMKETNNGVVQASVQDKPLTASSAGSRGYPKKCGIGAVAGIVLACAYIILRNLLDIRIHSGQELVDAYNIPLLGSIPCFDVKSTVSNNKDEIYAAAKGE